MSGRLGFLAELSEDTLRFAGENGFSTLELICDKGMSFDVGDMSEADMKKLRERFDARGVALGAFAWYCTNHIEFDANKRLENQAYLRKLAQASRVFGTNLVTIGTVHHPAASGVFEPVNPATLGETMDNYELVFSEYARIAEGEGLRLLIENCPEYASVCYGPEMYDEMFSRVPSQAIGLEYDPSHYYWQMIDYLGVIDRYGDRIHAVHGKDTEFVRGNLGRYGIRGKMTGEAAPADAWWRFRLPGWGELDWKEIFKRLSNAGFDGPVFIEHEDPVYTGDRREEGMLLGKKFLEQFIA